MSEQRLREPAGGPSPGESRARILDILRTAPAPLGVRDIAERIELHPNTVRFHLDALVKDGRAERRPEGRTQPGRPRFVYLTAAPADVSAGQRSYRLLAEMLTGLVTEALPHTAQASVGAGEAWGRYLVETPSPARRVDSEEAIRRLSKVLSDAGFSPGPREGEQNPVIPLRHCPFREIAEEQRDVVCSLHLGLVRGALQEVRAPVGVDRLEPFVEPSLCLIHLASA